MYQVYTHVSYIRDGWLRINRDKKKLLRVSYREESIVEARNFVSETRPPLLEIFAETGRIETGWNETVFSSLALRGLRCLGGAGWGELMSDANAGWLVRGVRGW